ncbi:GerAB/ArcD/ProY family transporter [Paenibacillus tengchongensis]|uniref:GerAB/ArcD/ProY family transporter n=1 Tax=Paenibacillus tengchongensis TaxID=2608684 RepID=UPI00124D9F8E|nr:GerAB/ArcD/ProY family transporter [Paenibacillus tengchongensis]
MRTTNWQMFRFSYVYFNAHTSIFLIPALITTSHYQGWVAILGGSVLSIMLLVVTFLVGRLKANQAWIDFGMQIMGKWLHRLMVMLLLSWCLYYASYDIENFVLFFGSNYLRGTPHVVIQVIIGLVIVYTASLGFATIVYMSDGIFLILIGTTLFATNLFLPNADFAMMPAFLHVHDWPLAFKDSITVATWFAQWVLFLFVAPDLKMNNKMLKKLIEVEIVITVIVLVGWIMTMLNFGPYLGQELVYPFLEMVRSSSHDDILGKMDPILIGIWSSSMFIHSAFLIHVAYRCALHLTNQRGKKFMLPLLTLIPVAIAYIYSHYVTVYLEHTTSDDNIIYWLIIECIPVYYAVTAYIRSKLRPAAK